MRKVIKVEKKEEEREEKLKVYRCEREGLVTMPPLLNNVFDHPRLLLLLLLIFSFLLFFSSQFTTNQGIVALLLAPLVDCAGYCIVPYFTTNQVLRWLSQRDKGHPLGDSKGFTFVETTLNVIYLFILKTTIMKVISISGFLSETKENGKTTKRVNYKVVIDKEIERRDKDGKKVMRNYFSASLTTLCNAILPYGIMIQSKMAQYTSQLVISDVLSAFLLGAEIEIKNDVQPVGTVINGEASKVETMKTFVTSAKPVSDPLLESFRLQMLSSLDAKVEELKKKLEEDAKKVQLLPNPFAAIPTTPTE